MGFDVWQTRSIAEAEVTVSIFTMLFAAALSTVKLLQGSVAVASTQVEAETGETALKEIGKMSYPAAVSFPAGRFAGKLR